MYEDDFDFDEMSFGMTSEEMLSEGSVDLLDFLPGPTRLVPLSDEEEERIYQEANDPNTHWVKIDF